MKLFRRYRSIIAGLWAQSDASVLADGAVPRRILVDVSVIARGDAGTGIQRVVRGLYLQLRSGLPAHIELRPVVATRRREYRLLSGDFPGRPPGSPLSISDRVTPQAGDIFLGLDLAAHILPRHAGQIRYWKRRGARIFLVVYDLLPAMRPEWFPPRTGRNFKRWLYFLADYADGAICISNHVRNTLVTWLDRHVPDAAAQLALSKIRLGADMDATLPSTGWSSEFAGLESRLETMRTVLMVGTIEPRKAHGEVLAAFEHLWATPEGKDVALVLVGRPGWKTEDLQERIRRHDENGRRLFWFADASDEQLERLYQTCSGVLAASLDEGFGLPVIEAASHKRPILARDIPVFREIAPPWTTYFNGQEPGVLAEAISTWLDGIAKIAVARLRPSTWEDARKDLFAALGLSNLTRGDCVGQPAQDHHDLVLGTKVKPSAFSA